MSVIDRQGRLLGRISILDLGALIIAVVAVIAILFSPGQQAGSVVQVGGAPTDRIEVDMIVRGVSSRTLDPIRSGEKADLIIRNQPYGQVDVVGVEDVTRTIPVSVGEGKIEYVTDPEAYRWDLVITVAGPGQKTDSGLVLGNNKVKIGIPLELETLTYNLRGTVMDVRLSE